MKININKQRVVITKEKVLKQCRKIPNWNALVTDGTGLLDEEMDNSGRQNCYSAS